MTDATQKIDMSYLNLPFCTGRSRSWFRECWNFVGLACWIRSGNVPSLLMTQHKQFFDMPGADSLPLKMEISKKQIIFQPLSNHQFSGAMSVSGLVTWWYLLTPRSAFFFWRDWYPKWIGFSFHHLRFFMVVNCKKLHFSKGNSDLGIFGFFLRKLEIAFPKSSFNRDYELGIYQ